MKQRKEYCGEPDCECHRICIGVRLPDEEHGETTFSTHGLGLGYESELSKCTNYIDSTHMFMGLNMLTNKITFEHTPMLDIVRCLHRKAIK